MMTNRLAFQLPGQVFLFRQREGEVNRRGGGIKENERD
jgi:hypothetical protein